MGGARAGVRKVRKKAEVTENKKGLGKNSGILIGYFEKGVVLE